MVTKGIIEKILNDNEVLVRLPIYNKCSNTAFATPTDQLGVAVAALQPGIQIRFNIGDIVFVAFENNDQDKLIILGYLHNKYESKLSGNFLDITVSNRVSLPNDTSIGAVSKDQIYSLKNVRGDVQKQIDDIVSTYQGTPQLYTVDIDIDDSNWQLVNGTYQYIISQQYFLNGSPAIVQIYDNSGVLLSTQTVRIFNNDVYISNSEKISMSVRILCK